MEKSMAEMATRNPNLPPNYVTLKQLQELRLQEKQREVQEEAVRLEKIKQEEGEKQQEENRRQPESSKSKKSRLPRSKPKAQTPRSGSSSENLTAVEAPDPKWSVKPPLEESIPNLETKSGETMKKKKKKKRRSKTDTNMKSVGEKPNPKPDNEPDKVSAPETVGPSARRSSGMRCGGGGDGDGTRVGMDVGEVEERSGSTVRMRGRRNGPNLVNREAVGGRGGMVWVPKSSA